MTQVIEEFSFRKGTDHLDVSVNNTEGWLAVKINLGDAEASFPIETNAEIDAICKKLKELLRQAQKECKSKS